MRGSRVVSRAQLLNVMDKWMVVESLLPMLERVQSREPGVLMALLGIYDEVRWQRLLHRRDRSAGVTQQEAWL